MTRMPDIPKATGRWFCLWRSCRAWIMLGSESKGTWTYMARRIEKLVVNEIPILHEHGLDEIGGDSEATRIQLYYAHGSDNFTSLLNGVPWSLHFLRKR